MALAHKRKAKPTDEKFDRELADLPQPLRWREFMMRVEAVIFAATSPVPRATLAALVGDGLHVGVVGVHGLEVGVGHHVLRHVAANAGEARPAARTRARGHDAQGVPTWSRSTIANFSASGTAILVSGISTIGGIAPRSSVIERPARWTLRIRRIAA